MKRFRNVQHTQIYIFMVWLHKKWSLLNRKRNASFVNHFQFSEFLRCYRNVFSPTAYFVRYKPRKA